MTQFNLKDMTSFCNQIIVTCYIHNFCIDENKKMGLEEDEDTLMIKMTAITC